LYIIFCLYRIRFFIFMYFFFSSRRRHTRSKRDWSSDVCSSDLSSSNVSPVYFDVYTNYADTEITLDDDVVLTADSDEFTEEIGRSEERRVGKECRSRRSQEKKKEKEERGEKGDREVLDAIIDSE